MSSRESESLSYTPNPSINSSSNSIPSVNSSINQSDKSTIINTPPAINDFQSDEPIFNNKPIKRKSRKKLKPDFRTFKRYNSKDNLIEEKIVNVAPDTMEKATIKSPKYAIDRSFIINNKEKEEKIRKKKLENIIEVLPLIPKKPKILYRRSNRRRRSLPNRPRWSSPDRRRRSRRRNIKKNILITRAEDVAKYNENIKRRLFPVNDKKVSPNVENTQINIEEKASPHPSVENTQIISPLSETNPKENEHFIEIPIDELQYKKYGIIIPVREMLESHFINKKYGPNVNLKKVYITYPVPIRIVDSIPYFSDKQLNDLGFLYERGLLSDYLSDVTPIYDMSRNVIDFSGPVPWRIEKTDTVPNNSKYFSEIEFVDKFGQTFKLYVGVSKVMFITVKSCESLNKNLCFYGCNWDSNKNICTSENVKKINVWDPKNKDQKWTKLYNHAITDLQNLLKIASLNSPIYLRVRNYHESILRDHLNYLKTHELKEKKHIIPKGNNNIDKKMNIFMLWNEINLNTVYSSYILDYIKIDEEAMEIITDPKKFFPNYTKNILNRNLQEIPNIDINIGELLNNMSNIYKVKFKNSVEIKENGVEIFNIKETYKNYLKLDTSKRNIILKMLEAISKTLLEIEKNLNIIFTAEIPITKLDVLEYLGDSYYQYVEYKYGIIKELQVNGIYTEKYLNNNCIYTETQDSNLVFNNKYYIVSNNLWSKNVICDIPARRLALLLGVNLSEVPPCFSSKPSERINRTSTTINYNDVKEYFLRNGKNYELSDYTIDDFKDKKKGNNVLENVQQMKEIYKEAIKNPKYSENIKNLKHIKFNKAYYNYLFDQYKNLSDKESIELFFENITPPSYFDVYRKSVYENILRNYIKNEENLNFFDINNKRKLKIIIK